MKHELKHWYLGVLAVAFGGQALASEQWQQVYSCAGDEAIVERYIDQDEPAEDETALYRLTLRNNDLNMYLGLGYLARPEGRGAVVTDARGFVGFNSVLARFGDQSVANAVFRTAHVFPDYGGLKVLTETEPYYVCNYDVLYGDSSGQTHRVFRPLGVACPNLYPSYGFRDTSAGSAVKTTRDWFFQNCSASQ